MTYKRIDDNQKQIVKDLRKIGATVQSIASIGNGCPDILVGYRGKNFVFEIKDGNKSLSQTKLTFLEKKWHDEWNGKVHTIYSANDAILILNQSL